MDSKSYSEEKVTHALDMKQSTWEGKFSHLKLICTKFLALVLTESENTKQRIKKDFEKKLLIVKRLIKEFLTFGRDNFDFDFFHDIQRCIETHSPIKINRFNQKIKSFEIREQIIK